MHRPWALHGQHRFADEPSKVREVLKRELADGAAVVVFHDENYQRSTKKATNENLGEFFEEMDRRSDLKGLKAEVTAAFEAGNQALAAASSGRRSKPTSSRVMVGAIPSVRATYAM